MGKGREDESQIGARFVACMWIFTRAAISLQSKDKGNFMCKLHSITEVVNKTWDLLYGAHEWIQQHSMELQESKIVKLLQFDIEVPCIMQWDAVVIGSEPSK